MTRSAAPSLLRAALVQRVHGVRGAVKAESLGDDPGRFHAAMELVVESSGERLTVRSVSALTGRELLMSFHGIETPEAAQRLRGAYLCVEPAAARPLGDEEWFVWQLVGLTAVDTEGTVIGEVTEVEPGAVHDILVVKSQSGERRFPMVHAFVEKVDLDQGRIVLTPWEEDA